MAQPTIRLRSRRFFAASLAIALLGSLIPLAVVSAQDMLSFSSSPNSGTAGVAFPTQPVVHDDGPTGTLVTLSIRANTGTTGAVLSCTGGNSLVTNGSGDAIFSGCKIDLAGNGYQIHATAPGAKNANSPAFNVTGGVADHLVFSAYPTSPTPVVFSPQPIVSVVDAGGNVVTTDNGRTISLTSNNNNGTFTCTTSTSRLTVNGVATFTGCQQTVAGTGYTLTATTTGLATQNFVVGPAFTVGSGTATQLALCWGTASVCNTTPPATVNSGVPFTLQPEIRVQDASGNTVIGDSTTLVGLNIVTGTPTSGGPGTLTCTGGNQKTVTAGIADFTGCSIDKAGVGYKLAAASSPALTANPANNPSLAFNVVQGPATKLVFLVQPPATATSGSAFGTNIQVAITDAGGTTVATGIVATIALTIGTNPSAGTLTCTGGNTATTVNGIATFTGCSINNAGNGYTLIATATATTPTTALTAATSIAINVVGVPAVISLTASNSVITWGDSVTLTTQFGANGANRAFTLQVSKDGVTFSNISGASLTTDGSGQAAFVYRPSDNRYYRAAFAGGNGLTAANSNVVRVVVRQINILRPAPSSLYHTISRGTAITFTSTIRPNRPELPQATAHFVVFQLGASGWAQVLDRMVPVNRANGVASLQVTFNTAGKFYVRSEAVPTTFNANSGLSELDRYIVR